MFILVCLLAAAWLLWSGLFKPLLIVLGAFSCALTVYLLTRMGYFGNETFALRYSPRILSFWAWLSKEIVLSSIDVARVVLRRRIVVNPETIMLDVAELETIDQVTLGNSITLTPGTLTLDVYENRMLVHALTAKAAADLASGEMLKRVAALRKR
jgi:multicomponent Na+:H+ antiporter subunit E